MLCAHCFANVLSPRLPVLGLLALLLAACQPPEAPPAEEPAVPVTTEVAARGVHQATVSLLGTVQPATTVEVVSTVAGTLSYPSRFGGGLRTGEPVAAGEVLAVVANEALELELAEARLNDRSAQAELERARRSFREGLVSEADLARAEVTAELAGERLANARLRT